MKCVKRVSIRISSSRRERAGMLAMVCASILGRLFHIVKLTYLAILFLCSQEARWINGLIMPVDGGVSELSLCRCVCFTRANPEVSTWQTTAGKADRPALKADTLAEQTSGIPNHA